MVGSRGCSPWWGASSLASVRQKGSFPAYRWAAACMVGSRGRSSLWWVASLGHTAAGLGRPTLAGMAIGDTRCGNWIEI